MSSATTSLLFVIIVHSWAKRHGPIQCNSESLRGYKVQLVVNMVGFTRITFISSFFFINLSLLPWHHTDYSNYGQQFHGVIQFHGSTFKVYCVPSFFERCCNSIFTWIPLHPLNTWIGCSVTFFSYWKVQYNRCCLIQHIFAPLQKQCLISSLSRMNQIRDVRKGRPMSVSYSGQF